MRTNTKAKVSTLLLLSIMSVLLAVAFVRFIPVQDIDVDDPVIETKVVGGILVNQDFNGLSVGDDPGILSGWTTTGDVEIWATEYTGTPSPNKKMVLGKDSSVTIELPPDGTGLPNRKRIIVTYKVKNTVEYNWDSPTLSSFNLLRDQRTFVPPLFESILSDDTGIAQSLKFGLVGYDDSETVPSINRDSFLDLSHDTLSLSASGVLDGSNREADLSWTLLGVESGYDLLSNNDHFYYAIYLRRTLPTDQDLIDGTIKPVLLLDKNDFTASSAQIKKGFLSRTVFLGTSPAFSGTWYVKVVPGFKSLGVLPEIGTSWTLINVPGGAGASELPISITPPSGRDSETPVDADFFFMKAVLDNGAISQASNLVTSYAEHDVLLGYDPVVSDNSAFILNNDLVIGYGLPAIDREPNKLVIKTGSVLGTWDSPSEGIFPRFFIDDLVVRYANQPEIDSVNVEALGDDILVLDDVHGELVSGEPVNHVITRTDQFNLEVIASDLEPFFSQFAERVDVTIFDESFRLSLTQKITPSVGRFDRIISIPSAVKNGELIEATVVVRNRFTLGFDEKKIYLRIFRYGLFPFTGINLADGNLTADFVLQIGTLNNEPGVTYGYDDLTPSTFKLVINNVIGVSELPIELDEPSLRVVGSFLEWSFEVNVNVTEPPFSFVLSTGDKIQIFFESSLEIDFSTVLSPYAVGLSSVGTYFVQPIDVVEAISITEFNGQPFSSVIDELDMEALDGIDVVVEVTDPTGGLRDNDVDLTLTQPSGDQDTVVMNKIASGIYNALIPTWWFNDETPGSGYEIVASTAGTSTTLEDRKQVEINFELPNFQIAMPRGSFGQTDTLELTIADASISGFDLPSFQHNVEVSIVNSSQPDEIFVEQSINPSDFESIGGGWRLTTPLFPFFDDGTYIIIVTISDDANFTVQDSAEFVITGFEPMVTVTLDVPTGQDAENNIYFGNLDMNVDVDTNSIVVDLLSIKYKILRRTQVTPSETWVTVVPYGFTPSGFPSNPLFTNTTPFDPDFSGFFQFDSIDFDGTYKILVLVETTLGLFETTVDITSVVIGAEIFTVIQVRPVIVFDAFFPQDPSNTYVTETEVRFKGQVTDLNGDLVTSTLFYDIPGVATNQLLSIDGSGFFDFAEPIGSFVTFDNTITIRARDSKMGISEFVSNTTNFTVDTSAPDIFTRIENLTNQPQPYYSNGDTVNMSADITDTVGLAYANLTIFNLVTGKIVYTKTFTVVGTAGVTEYFDDQLLAIDLTAFNVPDGARGFFKVQWNASNTNGRESTRFDLLTIDNRLSDISVLVEDTSSILVEDVPLYLLLSVNPPSGLSLSSITFDLINATDGTVLVNDRVPSLVAGIIYNASIDVSEVSTSTKNYIISINATSENKISRVIDVSLTINLVKPRITLITANDLVVASDVNSLLIEAIVTDKNGDLVSVEFRPDKVDFAQPIEGTPVPMTLQGGRYVYDFDLTGQFGGWELNVIATDSAGLETVAKISLTKEIPSVEVTFEITEPAPFTNVETIFILTARVLSGAEILTVMQYRIQDISPDWNDMELLFVGLEAFYTADINVDGLPSGTHLVEVRTVQINLESAEEDVIIVKIAPVVDLDAPVVEEPVVNGLNVELSWNAISGADGYQIFRSEFDFTDVLSAELIATIDQTSFSEALEEPGTYYYAVVAFNTDGRGDTSNVVMVTVTEPSPTFLDLIIQFFDAIVGFFIMIFSTILTLLGLVVIKRKRKTSTFNGIKTSLDCLANPGLEKCRTRDI